MKSPSVHSDPSWSPAAIKKAGKIVTIKGQEFRVVEKKERFLSFSTKERWGNLIKGLFLSFLTFGVLPFKKRSVRDLFTGREVLRVVEQVSPHLNLQGAAKSTDSKVEDQTQSSKVQCGNIYSTGSVTRENIHEYMDFIIQNDYSKQLPHKNEVVVEYDGKEVLLSSLTTAQKYDVANEHALPHDKSRLKKREECSSDEEWLCNIERLLFRGGYYSDGTPLAGTGIVKDPRIEHGCDHAMRVAVLTVIYASLYEKYDPTVEITPAMIIGCQIFGGFHDSKRQTEGIDLDDGRSARCARDKALEWGFDKDSAERGYRALLNKDQKDLKNKDIMAKCIQCADSRDFTRLGTFDEKYLDFYKEFMDEKKPLRNGRSIEELKKELEQLHKEMDKFIAWTCNFYRRGEMAKGNYYQALLQQINKKDFPKMHGILVNKGIIIK